MVLQNSAVPRANPHVVNVGFDENKISKYKQTANLPTLSSKREASQSTLQQTKLPDGSLCELFLINGSNDQSHAVSSDVDVPSSSCCNDYDDASITLSDQTESNNSTLNHNNLKKVDHSYSFSKADCKTECTTNDLPSYTSCEKQPPTDENKSIGNTLSQFSCMRLKMDKESQTEVTLHHIYNDVVKYQRELFKLKKKLEESQSVNAKLRKVLTSYVKSRSEMSGLSAKDLKAFVSLFNEDASSSSDDDLSNSGIPKLAPGDIAVPKKVTSRIKGNPSGGRSTKSESIINGSLTTNSDDIWRLDEVEEMSSSSDLISDPRDRPVVEIVYKQNVSTEDLYLQLNRRSPLTSSCELMIITVTMKEEKREDIDCNITEIDIDIRSPLYRLHLPLPHPIKMETANAEWDPVACSLILTLELVREFDAVNF